jgi:hypothetical protein
MVGNGSAYLATFDLLKISFSSFYSLHLCALFLADNFLSLLLFLMLHLPLHFIFGCMCAAACMLSEAIA